jgi:hypothetical protein
MSGRPTYIENIDTAFVNEEALEDTLDNNKTLPKHQHNRVDPGPCPSVEDRQEGKLGKECKGKKNEVHK